MKRIFISLPYGSDNPKIIIQRVHIAKMYFKSILDAGDCPVCPIVTGHQLVEEFGIMGNYETWGNYCEKELITCDEMHVLTLKGWRDSVGVAAEIKEAEFHNIPIVCTNTLYAKPKEFKEYEI